MLTTRRETILKAIIEQYISRARPVSSQSLIDDREMGVSSATVRNEMAFLEEAGYITHPHTSAGSVPSDKGYRYHVESIGDMRLSATEQLLVNHLFHQVEREISEWLNLAASLIARMVNNAAVVTTPRPEACRLKHLELISLRDYLGLIVLVLEGARVREELITFEKAVLQPEMTTLANKLSAEHSAQTARQVQEKGAALSGIERQVNDRLVKLMEAEDTQEMEELYFDGLHFTLSQPEFVRDHRMALVLAELVEQRRLLGEIVPRERASGKVQVFIGKENRTEAVRDYSIVVARYGLPDEATGTITVIGPTRMPYARTMATVGYLATILSLLMAQLYGREGAAGQS
ncbi:MAG: heat-inducible transcription repressor HrcA [Chloroflexi bacterium]|nr:heat-inducible transcription repressor HrcA [Chloroflexota bacterium]